MRSLRLAPEALKGSAEIRRFTRQRGGGAQANSYLRGLGQCFRRIAAGAAHPAAADEIAPGYRRLRYKSHMIYVRISPEAADVIRVLHAKQDHATHLAERDDAEET